MSTFENMKSVMNTDKHKLNLNNYEHERIKILSGCEDVILEAKRVLANEDIEKIQKFAPCTKKSAEILDWKNESFWKDLPNPRYNSLNKKVVNTPKIETITKQCIDSVFGDLLQNNVNNNKPQGDCLNSRTHFLFKKYFIIWKNVVELKRYQKKQTENQENQVAKLDELIRKLKKRKKIEKSKKLEEEPTQIPDHSGIQQTIINIPCSNYKNRFNAQKSIIQMQKAKLEAQSKIIEDLKLGIISEDILKSVDNTKIDIREIFGNCSEKLKFKIPLILKDESRFLVSSQKAPKIVQKMERRAQEREQNRQIILERKRLMEEVRQKMMQEAIEKKRILEEDEKKRSLELIKERRRKEMEIEKIRFMNKQKYTDQLNKANDFYNSLLTKHYFRKLYENVRKSREKNVLAIEFYKNKTFKKCIDKWRNFVESIYKVKHEIADAHFEYNILKRSVASWRKVHIENIRNMQVAEDLYDFRLTSNVFIQWNRYVCIQFMKEHKNTKRAKEHYKRWLLFHYFYLWKSLKVVNVLEKAKELKKIKWRQKVWEILPDYEPPEDI